MKFNERRTKAIKYIKSAMKILDIKDRSEKMMIRDLKDIAERIDATIIYKLK